MKKGGQKMPERELINMNTHMELNSSNKELISFQDPSFAQSLFGDIRWSWIWLILRVYVGWEWLSAGWGKLHSAAWTVAKADTAILGFVSNALSKTRCAHPYV